MTIFNSYVSLPEGKMYLMVMFDRICCWAASSLENMLHRFVGSFAVLLFGTQLIGLESHWGSEDSVLGFLWDMGELATGFKML